MSLSPLPLLLCQQSTNHLLLLDINSSHIIYIHSHFCDQISMSSCLTTLMLLYAYKIIACLPFVLVYMPYLYFVLLCIISTHSHTFNSYYSALPTYSSFTNIVISQIKHVYLDEQHTLLKIILEHPSSYDHSAKKSCNRSSKYYYQSDLL